MVTYLKPQPPFDFGHALRYLSRSDLEIVDRVEDGRYRCLLEYAGQYYLVQLTSPGTTMEPNLELSVVGEWVSDAVMAGLAGIIARMFNLSVDLNLFYRRVEGDPVLAAICRRFAGLRPVLTASVFEALAWAIIGQQVNLRFAYTLKKRLIEAAGHRSRHDGEMYYAFPGPRQLAGLTTADLTALKFSGRKADYLLDFARLVDCGGIDLAGLAGKASDFVVEALTSIRGIGRWTAEYCLMRGLGYPDALPAADIGLRNAVARYYQLPEQATETQVRELGETWSGWRSYATFYLWQALSQDKRTTAG